MIRYQLVPGLVSQLTSWYWSQSFTWPHTAHSLLTITRKLYKKYFVLVKRRRSWGLGFPE